MGREVDLLRNYPRVERDLTQRLEAKTESTRRVAREFGFDYFDGQRDYGYGGFHYNPRFWQPVVPTLIEHFNLSEASSVLDVGCAKGFLLHDLELAIPGISLKGIDVSRYAIDNVIESQVNNVIIGTAESLPFEDNSFDGVFAINTIHNLDLEGCAKALSEIQRVSGGHAFVTVDAYRNDFERERMEAWNLTALTMMSTDEWVAFFNEVGYEGDYYWFIP